MSFFASKYQGYLISLGDFSEKRNLFYKKKIHFCICISIALIRIIPTVMEISKITGLVLISTHPDKNFNTEVENLFIIYFGLMIYLLPQLVVIPGLIFINFIRSISKKREYITRNCRNASTFQLIIISLPNFMDFNFVLAELVRDAFPHWVIPSWTGQSCQL